MKVNENLNEKNDVELYNLFLKGNNQAFDHLITKYRRALTNFIMNYVKNIDMAEDIAQDSFLYMIIHKTEYDFKYSFRTYLYTIAKSRAINYLKSKKAVILNDAIDEQTEWGESIENDLVIRERNEALVNAIKTLKREYQVIIYLYYFQNFKYKEICKILNQSMPKTKMAIHRAKKILEKYMKEENNYDE